MGLFNFFSRSNKVVKDSNENVASSTAEISKNLSTGEPELNDKQTISQVEGIEKVYSFLQADYESKGYGDSLVHPDDSYKADNIKLIKLDLQILIEKTTTYYESVISELNYHISTRSRAGLIDLVQELENRKKLVDEYKAKINDIKKSMHDEDGMCQRIILSYQRGFMRGLSALSQSNILNKKI